MHNFNEMLFKFKGFQYATSIYLKMRYHHIRFRKTQVTFV